MPIHLSPRPVRAAFRRLLGSRRFWLLITLVAVAGALCCIEQLQHLAPIASVDVAP